MEIMNIVQYIILGVIPGAFWLWFFYVKDKHPEPVRKVIKIFFYGMMMTIPAVFVQIGVNLVFPFINTTSFTVVVISNFAVIAMSEEFFKFLIVKRTVYNDREFDEPFDGIIYSVSAALGFAVVEDIIVAITEGPEILFMRFITATLLHASTGAIIGYYLGRAKFAKHGRRALMATGLFIAVGIHGLYNTLIPNNNFIIFNGSLIPVFILLGVVFVFIFVAMRKSNLLGKKFQKKRSKRAVS